MRFAPMAGISFWPTPAPFRAIYACDGQGWHGTPAGCIVRIMDEQVFRRRKNLQRVFQRASISTRA
jgi:hypothetical protein